MATDSKTVLHREHVRGVLLEGLYDHTGGVPNRPIDLEAIAEQHGISREDAHAAWHYWMQERAIKSMGSGLRVCITNIGVHYMEDKIRKRDEQRYSLLRRIYEGIDSDIELKFDNDELKKWGRDVGLSWMETRIAFEWLVEEGLAEHITQANSGLTHEGRREVEQSLRDPDDGTEHFMPQVINNVTNFYAAVGAVQQGSNNVANVAQQINSPPGEVVKAFSTLRDAIDKLTGEEREGADAALEGLEDEAKAEKPKPGRVRAFASALNTYLTAYAPTINTLVSIILGKAPQLPE
jgi:hypothetical protein